MASKPAWAEQIARERIDILFDEAAQAFPEHPDRADRYVELARRIAMTVTVSLPAELRERCCPDCHAYLQPGENARVRVEDGVKTVTCGECGGSRRIAYND
ncbi:MAG: ribonuclease P protein component 4 [Candidatus Nanohaloarchaea archaeon]